MADPGNRRVPVGVIQALSAAAMFGLASPLAKLVLNDASPLVVAGLLYLGSGLGLGTWLLARRAWSAPRGEARLRRSDLPWLVGAIVAGGVLGPALQMIGLSRSPASSASLLLNLEGVFTALLAWLVFRENADRRIVVGMALVLLGGAVLSWPGRVEGLSVASMAIVAACAAWALDNNLTRKIATRDPLQIAALKGLCAGAFNVALGLGRGAAVPAPAVLGAAALLGLASYGVSLVLFVLALRRLGSARTAAYFSTAPFVGAVVAVFALGEALSPSFLLAGALMAAGLALHLAERHVHEHAHAELAHEHRHVHDEHHAHEHQPGDPVGEPHSHFHRHEGLRHAHAHYPDAHHGHSH